MFARKNNATASVLTFLVLTAAGVGSGCEQDRNAPVYELGSETHIAAISEKAAEEAVPLEDPRHEKNPEKGEGSDVDGDPRGILATLTDSAGAEAEIRTLLETQAQDWSLGRLEAFCAGYTDDATFISPTGLTQGRAAIFERYKKRYQEGDAEMGKLSFDYTKIEIGKELATVVLEWHLRFDADEPADGRSLVVLRKNKGSWEIIQDASM